MASHQVGDAFTAGHTRTGAALTELVLEVFQLNGRLLASGDHLVADIGLTSARWQVLGAVAMARGQLPVAHIARNMGLTRQAVQRIVNELAASGLVEFAPNPYHRRAHLVVLTAGGQQAYQAARDRQAPWANALAAGLDDQSLRTATQVLRTLIARLDNQPGLPRGEAERDSHDRDGSQRDARQPAPRHRRPGAADQQVRRRP